MINFFEKIKIQHPINKCGFTFLEIILSLALLSILTAVFGMGLVAAMDSYAFSRSNAEMAQKGQLTMQRINRELSELVNIRAVSSDPMYIIYERIENITADLPVTTTMGIYCDTTNKVVHLYRNLKDDVTALPVAEGALNDEGENIVNTLVDGVESLSVAYFKGSDSWDSNEDGMAVLSSIRITLNLERPENADRKQTFTSLVHLRNTDNDGGAVVY